MLLDSAEQLEGKQCAEADSSAELTDTVPTDATGFFKQQRQRCAARCCRLVCVDQLACVGLRACMDGLAWTICLHASARTQVRSARNPHA